MNNIEVQPIRVDRVPQPPFIDVPIYGRDRYVDHQYDQIFTDAELDQERPQDFHPGWWAVYREYKQDLNTPPWGTGKLLCQLPLRYSEPLDTHIYLQKMVDANPNPESFDDVLIPEYYIFFRSIFDTFERYQPEPELAETVSHFHHDIIKFRPSR